MIIIKPTIVTGIIITMVVIAVRSAISVIEPALQ